MPDRSLRLLTFPPRPVQGGVAGAALLRDRPTPPPTGTPRNGSDHGDSGPGDSGEWGSGQGGSGRSGSGAGTGVSGPDGSGRNGGSQDDNPFAPPPEGAPDRPWQPRHPGGPSGHGHGHAPGPGQGPGWGQGAGPGHGPGWGQGPGQGQGPGPGQGQGPGGGSPSGSHWSDRQPGRSPGNFGERPGSGPQGPGGPAGTGKRWDPADPAQRRARYALLSGMWAVFFVLFSWPYVALLLGVLALYWGSSALRAKPRRPAPDTPGAPHTPAATNGRPQTTAAVSGLVTASLALVMVASTFTVQLVYRDYYTCVGDALTHEAKQSCETLLPHRLRGVLGVENG
ncbi:hypothetical protein [Streptomyces dangxiongensis]|uniref:hypothetical protein n=1 Tax=Streptomyces dangxiongensis TaxID=1442032 RepID=UPI0013CEAA09|nr:hypothetical protein [Streptomyces dangxiongensis]